MTCQEKITGEQSSDATPAFACRLDAFDPEQLPRYMAIRQQVVAAYEDREELTNGYRWRFPVEPSLMLTLAEFISLERLCCPFFSFALELEADGGPVWLRLTGREGVKDFLQAAFVRT